MTVRNFDWGTFKEILLTFPIYHRYSACQKSWKLLTPSEKYSLTFSFSSRYIISIECHFKWQWTKMRVGSMRKFSTSCKFINGIIASLTRTTINVRHCSIPQQFRLTFNKGNCWVQTKEKIRDFLLILFILLRTLSF